VGNWVIKFGILKARVNESNLAKRVPVDSAIGEDGEIESTSG